jgi:dTDP-D-glucose 4,6-dehydratase
LGYAPEMEFDQGLNATVAWFQKNWERLRHDAEFPPGMSAAARGVVVKPRLEPK